MHYLTVLLVNLAFSASVLGSLEQRRETPRTDILKAILANQWRGAYALRRRQDITECCPSIRLTSTPRGGVTRDGTLVELYRSSDLHQKFYETICQPGVEDRSCQLVAEEFRSTSMCVQDYSYSYALVRDYGSTSDTGYRMDFIRIKSGCICRRNG